MSAAIAIREVCASDLVSLNNLINEVSAERRYLATIDGFTLEAHKAFLEQILARNLPQYVAVDNGIVVGWCDILPMSAKGFEHVGRLGMGVHQTYRKRGLGRRLLAECLRAAAQRGIEKVELEVFSDNVPAVRLYESFGFQREGCRAYARKLDGDYQDVLLMARFLEQVSR